MKERFAQIKEKLKADKKLAIILFAGFIGIVLLVLSEIIPQNENYISKEELECDETTFEVYEKNLENRLEGLLESINGAGKVKVMVTIESGDERIYATENTKSERSEEKSYVIIDSQGDDSGLLIKVSQPIVRGVAVVCQGADQPIVREEITNTVVSVLGISTNRVNIAKMRNDNGG